MAHDADKINNAANDRALVDNYRMSGDLLRILTIERPEMAPKFYDPQIQFLKPGNLMFHVIVIS